MESVISYRGFAAQGNFPDVVDGVLREAKDGEVCAFDYEILVTVLLFK